MSRHRDRPESTPKVTAADRPMNELMTWEELNARTERHCRSLAGVAVSITSIVTGKIAPTGWMGRRRAGVAAVLWGLPSVLLTGGLLVLHRTHGASWQALTGFVVSVAGIAVSVWMYGRAAPANIDCDPTALELSAGVEARLHNLTAKINLKATGIRPDRTVPVDSEESEEVPSEFRTSYSEHEVAAFYEAMSDEELGFLPDDDSGVA